MRELSLNVLDVAENSIEAGASLIVIEFLADEKADSLIININDNGKGMTKEQINSVCDPFYTTRTTRKVGLGVPLFKMAAEMSGGSFDISSTPGKGTKIKAVFGLSNIDRMPVGDIRSTICSLIRLNPDRDLVYREKYNESEFKLSTLELREVLDGVPINDSEVMNWINDYFKENSKFR